MPWFVFYRIITSPHQVLFLLPQLCIKYMAWSVFCNGIADQLEFGDNYRKSRSSRIEANFVDSMLAGIESLFF